MAKRKNFEEDIPERYYSNDGEDLPSTERHSAYDSLSSAMRHEVVTDDHLKLVARYAFNSLSIAEKQLFDEKFSNNKFVKFQLNDMYSLIEDQQLDSYEQCLSYLKLE